MNWAERSKVIIDRAWEGDTGLSDDDHAEYLTLVNERLDAEGLRNKVWMVMPYRCDNCGLIAYYECEVGVEGPPSWKSDGTFLASPFGGERCASCGKDTTHLMGRDVIFDEPVEPGTPFVGLGGLPTHASRYFRVVRKAVTHPTQGCDDDGNVIYGQPSTQAFLSWPMHAITRVRSGR